MPTTYSDLIIAVARFFFHVHNGIGIIEDEDGRELPSLARAGEEATKGIRSIVSAEALKGRIDLRGWIEIMDAAGAIVLTVHFEEALEIMLATDRRPRTMSCHYIR